MEESHFSETKRHQSTIQVKDISNVYVIENERQFGFAYGTLPGHVECGEELFLVENTEEGTVRYVIKAFSRPRFWRARLGYPLARWYQKKFVRDSKRSMLAFVSSNG